MKRVFIIITSLLITAMAVIVVIAVSPRESHVSRAEAPISAERDWTSAYSRYVNRQGISILVDDVNVSAGNDAYLDENGTLMIEKELLKNVFECSVSVLDESTVYIFKGAVALSMDIGSYEISVRELYDPGDYMVDTREAEHTPFWDGRKLFIPADVMTVGAGYRYQWEAGTSTAVFVSENPSLEYFAPYYNFENIGTVRDARNQGNLGACWAFAALSAAEYTLQPEETRDFSEDHMLYNNSYVLDDLGGDYLIAVSYLTSWKGPVNEEDDPYNDGYTDSELQAVKHVQEVQFLPERDFSSIKKNILKYGAVESSVYIELNEDNTDLDLTCYDPETYSYVYTGDLHPNHEIVIIGWDDNYPKEYFPGNVEENGAFICKNSWGDTFGDNGTFYVSYSDTVIGSVAVVYSRIEDPDNYDHIYQLDDAGWVGLIGYGRNKAYMANVYTAEGDEDLKAVGFYATGENTTYKVYVCSDYKGTQSLDVHSKVLAQGTFRNAGYYTVDLFEAVRLEAGQKYAVIVEISTPSSTKPAAIEISTSQVTADMQGKESYLSSFGDQWECLQSRGNGNLCLKAYTSDRAQ